MPQKMLERTVKYLKFSRPEDISPAPLSVLENIRYVPIAVNTTIRISKAKVILLLTFLILFPTYSSLCSTYMLLFLDRLPSHPPLVS